MTNKEAINELSYAALKSKHRAVREGFSNDLSLRVHRALSWLNRAEEANGEPDASFIFYWIAFNAAYADEMSDLEMSGERTAFADYFATISQLDKSERIYNAIWERFPQSIRLLLNNKYVFQPFWKHHNGAPGYDNWEDRFNRSKGVIAKALERQDTKVILTTLFDRMYVLRNQLVHGGATWNSSVNREQVGDGSAIMSLLVPLFIDIMMDAPETNWGAAYYPVVN